MNKNKLFGICIVLLLALTLVNAATPLDNLLNGYNSNYDDGSFTVSLSGASKVDTDFATNSGSNTFNFNISGSGTYTIISKLTIFENGLKEDTGLVVEMNNTGSGTIPIDFDGLYYGCTSGYPVTYKIDLGIYQNGILRYQNEFDYNSVCNVYPVQFDYTGSKQITAVNSAGGSGFDYINASLSILFTEARTYRIGAYIWDNQSASAYKEYTITTSTFGEQRNIDFIFTSDQVKDFNLTKGIFLKSIVVDGNILKYPVDFYIEYSYNNIGDCVPCATPSKHSPPYSASQFEFSDIYVNNYAFNTSHTLNGKISELGLQLNSVSVNGAYDADISLENQAGESIDEQNISITNNMTTIWFNGTNIYNSKVSGPYKIGHVRITKNNQEVYYKDDVAVSPDLAYTNFTAPSMPDLKVNDSDVQIDGNNLNVTVYNQGTGDAEGATISVFDNSDNKIKEIIADNIPAGSSYFYRFSNASLTNGFVVVDFNNQIEESNESNNIASIMPAAPINNSAPVITSTPLTTAFRNSQYNYTLTATDADGNILSYSVNDSSFVQSGNNFTWTPNATNFGKKQVTFSVTDGIATVNQSVTISLLENTYILETATLDYTANTFISSTITANSQTQNTDSTAKLVNFTMSSNTEYAITHSSTGYTTDTDYLYFDSKLTSCTQGQDCTLSTTGHTTTCQWQATSSVNGFSLPNSWYCSIEGGTLEKKTWFRYAQTPEHIIRRFNYLLK